jgi:hypothetical protein
MLIPYSFISKSEPDPQERKILYGLFKELESRGYRYSTDPGNLDFIATVRLSSIVDSTEYPHVTYLAPSLDQLAPYLPDDADTVRMPEPVHRVSSLAELFIYDAKNLECAGQFLGATIDSDANYLAAAEKMLPVLVQWRLPRNMENNAWDTLIGNGMAGLNFTLASDEGEVYPRIDWIVPNSAAGSSKLSVGDYIVALDGISTKNVDRPGIFQRMKGSVGRRLAITIKHVNNIIEDTLIYGPRH